MSTIAELEHAAAAPNTRRAHASRLASARSAGLPWPPTWADVERHVEHLAESGAAISTVRAHLSTIRACCRAESHDLGEPNGRAAILLRGYARLCDDVDGRQAAPMTSSQLADAIDTRPRWALSLALGWHGALRAGEIVDVRAGDVAGSTRGIIVEIRGGKSPGIVAIGFLPPPFRDYCAARLALAAASSLAREDRICGIRSARTVRNRIKTLALELGWPDPDRYTGHSLRAGWATEAAARGVRVEDVAFHLRHRHVDTTRRYTDRGERWVRAHVLPPQFDGGALISGDQVARCSTEK